ncbi:putative metal-binding motif-containing protein, partial [Myxococcota bacterium]|nr:putative metal-binding motif-containing protein [Myxococcota bacterium]
PPCPDFDQDGWQDAHCNRDVARRGGDCDDQDVAIHPGRDENCDNGIDNDCNGLLPDRDPACVRCADLDQDGWQDIACNADINNRGGDCDDQSANVNPGLNEICGNFRDDDCQNGDVPCIANCTDADMDGFGVGSGCRGPDCDDTKASVHPWASEICGDGVDQDCNGQDLACPDDCTDRDKDSFGVGDGCVDLDCDDSNPNINPGAWDIAGDGVDQDCSGRDTALVQNCMDRDGDAYGEGAGCLQVDCDDANPRIHRDRREVCGNGIDDDCLGGDMTCIHQGTGECTDVDGDGFGVGGCPLGGPDCDDNDADVNPSAREVCNGRDDNCNTITDECPLRGQVCDNGACVGGPGAPCQADNECASSEGLICNQQLRECRLENGAACEDSGHCQPGAACELVSSCDPALNHCYQTRGGPCQAPCDCGDEWLCHTDLHLCVACFEDFHCNRDARTSCSSGGICATRAEVGGAGVDAQIQILTRMAACWRLFAETNEIEGCDILVTDATLEVEGEAVAQIDGGAEALQTLLCESSYLTDAGVSGDDITIIEELFGCGLFDLINAYWGVPVAAGADGAVCITYVPAMPGFGWPDDARPAVVVERCTRTTF